MSKVEEFEMNKEYVFSAKNYIDRGGENIEWAYKYDGQSIKVFHKFYAEMGKREYGVIPAWAEEITK